MAPTYNEIGLSCRLNYGDQILNMDFKVLGLTFDLIYLQKARSEILKVSNQENL